MSSRSLMDLSPRLRPLCQKFLDTCHLAGIEVIVTCTYRSESEQAALYAQGRTAPGPVVTWTPPGKSKHNATDLGRPSALAFDVVPLRAGKLVWGTDHPEDLALWNKLGEIGADCGLEWGGHWNTPDRPHFQMRK